MEFGARLDGLRAPGPAGVEIPPCGRFCTGARNYPCGSRNCRGRRAVERRLNTFRKMC